ncbi:B2 protein [Dichanthelium oligosanthes]|uniref:B2 protein n=1 Tax=Dichanthelium oligosanthes TaxID=888268 RepID=A0A1E5VXZ0_9POAL|nr:B2 protein [Dichanthelium oligosanthes]
MEGYDREFWQFSDQLRLQNNFSNLSIADSIWSASTAAPNNSMNDQSAAAPWKAAANANSPGLIGSATKLAFGNATTTNADRYNYFPANAAPDTKSNTHNSGGLAFNKNLNSPATGAALGNDYYFNKNGSSFNTNAGGDVIKSYFNKSVGRPANNNNNNNNSSFSVGKKSAAAHDKKKSAGNGNGNGTGVDKRFKSLPAAEALPRGEAIGGYIFVCNNDTMEENLKRQLFGLPSRYRDSVRAIRPGLPLFLYNYSTHQLHGIFEAASFGGSNIDPTAWEDKKCPGESRFPAQVRVATRKICDPLEEDAFRPILHHYDGPKFRLELSVPEALSLLDIFAEKVFA